MFFFTPKFTFGRQNSDPNMKKASIKEGFSQNKFRFESEFVYLFGIKFGLMTVRVRSSEAVKQLQVGFLAGVQ